MFYIHGKFGRNRMKISEVEAYFQATFWWVNYVTNMAPKIEISYW